MAIFFIFRTQNVIKIFFGIWFSQKNVKRQKCPKITKAFWHTRHFVLFLPSAGCVAQLNRASDYGSEGFRFESWRGHWKSKASENLWGFFVSTCIILAYSLTGRRNMLLFVWTNFKKWFYFYSYNAVINAHLLCYSYCLLSIWIKAWISSLYLIHFCRQDKLVIDLVQTQPARDNIYPTLFNQNH